MTVRIRGRALCAFECPLCKSNKNRVTEVTLLWSSYKYSWLGDGFHALDVQLVDAADCAAGVDDVDVEGAVDLDGGAVDVVGDLVAAGDFAGDEVLGLGRPAEAAAGDGVAEAEVVHLVA